MTPLAHRIAKELTAPVRRRSFHSDTGQLRVLPNISRAHCFEVSAVLPLMGDLIDAAEKGGSPLRDEYIFLPANPTWIELSVGAEKGRVGFMLYQPSCPGGELMCPPAPKVIEWVFVGSDSFGVAESGAFVVEQGAHMLQYADIDLPEDCQPPGHKMLQDVAVAALAIINTPRLIGRCQHMPHRGLERSLRGVGAIGRYPLHAWHEIILEARPTYYDHAGVEREAHLTGRRCLHFCRSHLRVRSGRLELVSAHWRGDPALGIRRARYQVIPPRIDGRAITANRG